MKSGLHINMDKVISAALKEDITSDDVSTMAVMPEDSEGSITLFCKEDGILAGIDVFSRTFNLLDPDIVFETTCKDGDLIKKGETIGVLIGSIQAMLTGERTALNFLGRMSGIATLTSRYAKVLEGTKTKLLDTRKTTPNLRLFEKYAVTVGGGHNHRYNLSDGVMLKDNHLDAAGGVSRAIEMARSYAPFVRKIEVEVENLEMLKEALSAGVDIIMLDNMDIPTMTEAVAINNGRAALECSGNVTLDRLPEIAKTGVDYVSCGALTHSAPILDFSMKYLKVFE